MRAVRHTGFVEQHCLFDAQLTDEAVELTPIVAQHSEQTLEHVDGVIDLISTGHEHRTRVVEQRGNVQEP